MMTEMHYDEATLRAIENTSFGLNRNDSIHFARQLEFIKSQTYDVKRVQLNALTLMPVSTAISEGASTHTYRQYDGVGMAKIIANYADDMPRSDVTGKEFTAPIRGIGSAYGYNVQEIRAAMFSGTNLNARKALQAARAQQEAINKFAFFGDTEYGLPGFVSNTNIPAVVLAADGTGSSKTFSSKTADKIVRDVNSVINKVLIQSKGVHKVNQVWLPLAQYALIATTQNSTASDTTVLEFLKSVNPGVTFNAVQELTGAGAAGVDRMYAMENSMDNWQLEIPMMIKQHSPQQRNLDFVVNMESRFAGCIIEYPMAFAYADGI